MDLIQQQRQRLAEIMNLNRAATNQFDKQEDEEYLLNEDDFCWKVLVYDEYCQDLMSCLMKVGHLRTQNITLHMNIHQQKQKVEGVETIYLLQYQNNDSIIDDLRNKTYGKMHINFIGPISNKQLEEFAMKVGRTQQQFRIQQVFHHCLQFQTLNDRFYSLNMKQSYKQLHSNDGQQQDQLIDQIVNGLQSVLDTIDARDIHLFSLGSISNQIADRVDQKIKQKQKKEKVDDDIKTAVVILERNIDQSVVLLHPWHYGALMNDVYGIRNNKIKAEKVDFDLDFEKDQFWKSKMNEPFPYVAEDLENQLNEWKSNYENMAHKKAFNNANDMSQNLSSALDQIPEMTEKKKRIDNHTNISSLLLDQIKNRKLDQFFELGQSIMNQSQLQKQDLQELQTLLEDGEVQVDDLLRILLICYIEFGEKQNNIVVQIEEKIKGQDNKGYSKALDKIKRMKNIKELKIIDGDKGKDYLNYLASKVKSKGKNLMSNLQKILINDKKYKITKIVENVNENNWGLIDDSFQFIDVSSNKRMTEIRGVFDDYDQIVVFMADGCCYNEFENLQSLSKVINKPVIKYQIYQIYYGGSGVYNGIQLVEDLAELD